MLLQKMLWELDLRSRVHGGEGEQHKGLGGRAWKD